MNFELAVLAVVVASSVSLVAHARSADDARARKFIAEHEARIRPLEKSASLAWWNANVSGKDEDFKAKEQAQNKLARSCCVSRRSFTKIRTRI